MEPSNQRRDNYTIHSWVSTQLMTPRTLDAVRSFYEKRPNLQHLRRARAVAAGPWLVFALVDCEHQPL
jgi:hypothetical protein